MYYLDLPQYLPASVQFRQIKSLCHKGFDCSDLAISCLIVQDILTKRYFSTCISDLKIMKACNTTKPLNIQEQAGAELCQTQVELGKIGLARLKIKY